MNTSKKPSALALALMRDRPQRERIWTQRQKNGRKIRNKLRITYEGGKAA